MKLTSIVTSITLGKALGRAWFGANSTLFHNILNIHIPFLFMCVQYMYIEHRV